MGATVGTAVGLGTAGLIFNNKTNLEIKEINSSLEKKILELAENGLTKSEVDDLIAENGILHYNNTDDVNNNTVSVIDKYKKNLYELISKKENFDSDDKFLFSQDKHLLGDIEEAEANAIGSLNIGEKITYGFLNTVNSLGEKFSIKEMAKAQEKALKAQQASVYMGTELPQSVQTETVNER